MLNIRSIHGGFCLAFSFALGVAACGDDSSGGGDGNEAGSANGGAAGNVGSAGMNSAGSSNESGTTGNGGVAGTNAGGSNAAGGKGGIGGAAGTNATAGTGGGGTSATGGTGGTDAGGSGASGEGNNAGASGDSPMAGAGGEGGAPTAVDDGFGSGLDGVLSVDGEIDISVHNSGARTCADGGDAVSYSLSALTSTSATLTSTPAAGCLAAGDEVLLINLQGTVGAHDDVGNYETLKIASVVDGTVTFTAAKTRFYGDTAADDTNIGVARNQQRVMLQRVPQYSNVTIAAAGSLTAGAWDGVKGGVLFFRASGTVNVAGAINMSGKGYAGGARTTVVNTTGSQGESIAGLGIAMEAPNQGGGGGGIGDGNSCNSYGAAAAGGGYATPGDDGTNACSGNGGQSYGEASLRLELLLGSGGGAGGTDNFLGDNPPGGFGGRGGGIVAIMAKQLTVAGQLLTSGSDGEGDLAATCSGVSTVDCWDFSGPGGGGSGGSVLFDVDQASLGAELVTAAGGLGGQGRNSGDAGNGGSGRIATHAATSLEGTTLPVATVND